MRKLWWVWQVQHIGGEALGVGSYDEGGGSGRGGGIGMVVVVLEDNDLGVGGVIDRGEGKGDENAQKLPNMLRFLPNCRVINCISFRYYLLKVALFFNSYPLFHNVPKLIKRKFKNMI